MLTADVGAIAHFKCQGSALDEISGHEITKDGKIELRVKFIRQVNYKTYKFMDTHITKFNIFVQLIRFLNTLRR